MLRDGPKKEDSSAAIMQQHREGYMCAKAYVFIDVSDGKSEQVVKTLQNKPGVVAVDNVDGPPDVIMIVEATKRQELANLTIEAMLSVEGLTESVRCLPVIEKGTAYTGLKTL